MTAHPAVGGVCRRCGGQVLLLGVTGAMRTPATSYETCLHECQSCWTRYSNARDPEKRTAFVARPADNIPAEITTGVTEVLDRAINDGNRQNKREKFCAETSEDAVTWTVFRWLQQQGVAALVPVLGGAAEPKGSSSLLLWGAPAGGEEAEWVRRQYEAVSELLGEKHRSRTEVDVLLVWEDLLIAIEVKYKSRNDRKSGRVGRLARYVRSDRFTADVEAVDELGFYELTRNWALGTGLADVLRRRFLMVNLGPDALRGDIELLKPQLSEGAGLQAAFLSWRTLVDGIRSLGSAPPWLTRYLEDRGLVSPARQEQPS